MDFSDFKHLIKNSWHRAGFKINILIICSFISSLLELLGFGLIIPLLEFSNISSNNIFLDYFRSFLNFLNMELTLNSILLIILVVFFLKNIFSFICNNLSIWITTGIRINIQNEILKKFEEVNYEYFASKKIGEHINLITREAERYETVISNLTKGIIAFVSTIIFLGSLTIVEKDIIFIIIFLLFFFFLLFLPIFRKTREYSFLNATLYSKLNAYLIEFIQNYLYLKGTSKTKSFNFQTIKLTKELVFVSRRLGMFANLLSSVKEPLGVSILVGLIYIKVLIYKEPLSSVIIIGLILYRVSQKIIDLQNNWQRLNQSSAGLFNIENAIKDLDNKTESDSGLKIQKINFIKLKDICFSYNNKNKLISRCNLSIQKNSITGIKGKSGVGKSTLIKLILGLIHPESGNVIFNNLDIKKINTYDLRLKVGYVSQEINLFNGTIRENITFWDEYKFDLKKVKKTMRQAGCSELLDRLNENVGDQASRLSGGQKQRIIIARELYKDPQLIVFDEPTSALDIKNERIIKETIKKIRSKYMVIIISHRQSLLDISNKLYQLKNKRLESIKK